MDGSIEDSVKPVETRAADLNGLSDFSMKDFASLNQRKANTFKNLGDTLFAMTLYSNDGAGDRAETKKAETKKAETKRVESKKAETKKAPPCEEIESEDLKRSHVNASKTVEDGRKVINAEYPNGIGIKVKEAAPVETIDGRFHVQSTVGELSLSPDLKQKGGSWFDASGKEIIKRNNDGSYTIDSGEGFFRQGATGIEKVNAVRERNGSFHEIKKTDEAGQ